MNEKIVSNAEIAILTGLTADAKMEILNTTMTRVLAELIGISTFEYGAIAFEEVKIGQSGTYLRLKAFPVDIDTIEIFEYDDHTTEITGYTYRADPSDFRKFYFLDADGKQTRLCRDYIYCSYSAGYYLESVLQVLDNDLAALNLTVSDAGVSTIYTFIASGEPTATQILLGATAALTATAIATKFGGVVDDDIVTFPFGVRVASSEVTPTKLEIVNANVPDELKLALAYMVAGAVSDKSQIEGVSAYKLGTKSVNFRDTSQADYTKNIIDKYASKFKTVNIFS